MAEEGGARLQQLAQLLLREAHEQRHLLRLATEVLDAECVHADARDAQAQAPVQRLHQLQQTRILVLCCALRQGLRGTEDKDEDQFGGGTGQAACTECVNLDIVAMAAALPCCIRADGH